MNHEKLKSLFLSDPNSKVLLEALIKGNHKGATSVEGALQLFKAYGVTTFRGQVVHLFKQFQKAECGRFVTGRRGSPSRLRWSHDVSTVAKAALTGKLNESGATESTNLEASVEIEEISGLNHQFHLRPNYTVNFELPTNLSGNEASRLAKFIESLPMVS